jgi:AcrR family transcriptional regulator
MPLLAEEKVGDRRRQRGDATRRIVAARSAEIASLEGLEGVSIGRLATDLGLTKSGIQAVYGTKENLQLATVATARAVFVDHVVAPALKMPAGRPRLDVLIDAWLDYVQRRIFPGGCFMVATLPEFDSRPGPVRDALSRARTAWLDLLAQEVTNARSRGQLGDSGGLSPSQLAFEIDALLSAANTARNLADDSEPLDMIRTLIALRLGSPPSPLLTVPIPE